MVSHPVTTTPYATIQEVDDLCGRYRVSGLPVIDEDGKLVGIVTNRDMRFVLEVQRTTTLVKDVMTIGPKTIQPDALAAEAVLLMQTHKIQGLLVVDDNKELAGALNFHDLLNAGVV